MSWMKRGQAGTGPGAQPYAAPQAQPFENQQKMYPNYQQGGTGTAPQPQQPQQQFWQLPPQQPPQQSPQQLPQQLPQQYNHGQQYGQPYPQDYQPPAQTPYNQNYANQGYVNPQPNYQQNCYQNQPQQNYTQNAANTGMGNADGWEDNWDWGWEENAKKAQSIQNMAQQPPVQQQVINNANVIEESFASTDTWNWAMDEKKESIAPAAIPPPTKQEINESATLPTHPVRNNVVSEPASNNTTRQQAEEVKTLSDTEVIKERLPNLALGKRFHLENLTPQWSIESQMSQESSDGPHTLSEGTYRSENQSRNSGESPGPNTDNSNFNYAQPGFDETYTQNSEWSKNSDEPTVADGTNNISRRESAEELSNSLQEMSIATDHHSTNSIQPHLVVESRHDHQPMSMPPPPPAAALQMPQSSLQSIPRPPSSSSTSSLSGLSGPPTQANLQPPPMSSTAMVPPSLPSNSQNPFQRAAPFSHKTTSKSSSVPPQPFQPQMTSSNLTSPAVVNKVSQSRGPVGFEANLETTPDNSERPDQPQVLFRPMPVPQSIPDNMEVAPQNDRNEYLQTAHLSSGNYGENTDFTRNLPPPGLRRMVVGQQESEYQNLNISGDEPPPGLARMVPGQQTEGDSVYDQPSDNYMDRHIDGQPMDNASGGRPFRQADGQQNPDNYSQPVTTRANDRRPVGPVGFDRMVPGEPSNDEYSQYQGSNYASNEQRVVTGVDHDFPIHIEASPSDVREQNMDGSDYTEPAPRNVIGARELPNEVMQDYTALDETQREVIMEGENLQDLSAISSADLTYSREQLDGADTNVTDGGTDRNEASDSLDRPTTSSRKQSLNALARVHSSGEDSERDRAFKASPRRGDRHKTSRDRDRDRHRERDKEGRYSRGDRSDRKYDREDRRRDDKRTDKDRRDRERGREGDVSPDANERKLRRSTRSRRYEDDDTDYYSDRERDRRLVNRFYPPRPDERPYEDRRYATRPRDATRDRPRDSTRRDRDRYDRHYADYRDIDPSRKYGNLRREREDERRRGDTFSSASRPDSREAGATDEDAPDARRSQPRTRRTRHHRPDPYYDAARDGPGRIHAALQAADGGPRATRAARRAARRATCRRRRYEYYEQLRVTDPAAYMLLYKQLMAGHAPPEPRDVPLAARHVAGEGTSTASSCA
ncbi:Dentin matrix acidic phosphoprotein 1 [Operophtera brumata]|uniref:Dentin matrix acidic phosphoprotein 1 n=1 Tax=Operophtera brumata TaxID=104452 RepID=A0A0L7LDN7_OPEBR|nr:Dentin matrix acidic phosphoprotein 1 [Operophtera brumata]